MLTQSSYHVQLVLSVSNTDCVLTGGVFVINRYIYQPTTTSRIYLLTCPTYMNTGSREQLDFMPIDWSL